MEMLVDPTWMKKRLRQYEPRVFYNTTQIMVIVALSNYFATVVPGCLGAGRKDRLPNYFYRSLLLSFVVLTPLCILNLFAGELTAESTAEQAGAGLDRCSPEEFARFTELNDRYGAKFGHPFIIAVRGLDRAAILAAFETRVNNDPATEFATALAEVHKIARLRLELLADQG